MHFTLIFVLSLKLYTLHRECHTQKDIFRSILELTVIINFVGSALNVHVSRIWTCFLSYLLINDFALFKW